MQTRRRVVTDEKALPMYLLEVLSGPFDGKTWSFEREITIGRDDTVASACLALDRYVSRKHARLLVEGERVHLWDLESRNGIKIEGTLIEGEAHLALGATFLVGRTVLRVTHDEASG